MPMNFTQKSLPRFIGYKFLFCKADDWAAASATAIEYNDADRNLGK